MTFVSMNCVTPDPEQAEEFEQAFKDWIGSDLFKQAHRGDGQRSFAGHSELRTYEVIDVEQPA
jgi:heme-degrading monooxygenase HmoA